jgi:acetyl esterase/lipase
VTGPAPLLPPAHTAPLPPALPGAGGTRALRGLPYAAIPGIRPLELDLYLPAATDRAPVAVFLHGGGWRAGTRHTLGPAYPGERPHPFEQAGVAVAVTPDAPPFLLLHGTADGVVPCVQSERLYAALLEAGVEVELDVYEDAEHMWLGAPEAARQALDRTVDVLRRRFGIRG